MWHALFLPRRARMAPTALDLMNKQELGLYNAREDGEATKRW